VGKETDNCICTTALSLQACHLGFQKSVLIIPTKYGLIKSKDAKAKTSRGTALVNKTTNRDLKINSDE